MPCKKPYIAPAMKTLSPEQVRQLLKSHDRKNIYTQRSLPQLQEALAISRCEGPLRGPMADRINGNPNLSPGRSRANDLS